MLASIKKLVPDNIKVFLKNIFSTKKKYGWYGNYLSWDKAQKKCSGYDNILILNKVKQAVLKVKHGEAIYERDSVLFDEIYLFKPIVNALKNSVNNNQLHIVDFGGSLGSSYFQHKHLFNELTHFKWTVVEQTHFVETGKNEISDSVLNFEESINDALKTQHNQVLLLFTVLQYLPNAHDFIKKLIDYKFEYILIDRTSFITNSKDIITVQTVPPEIYKASYPCWFFNEKQFVNYFLPYYDLISEFDNEFPATIILGNEKGYWKGFYFKLRKT